MSVIGVIAPRLFIPNPSVDLAKWSVVACDQHSSEPEYWDRVADLVGSSPSALKLVLPECYLDESDPQARLNNIHKHMLDYLNDGTLLELEPAFHLVCRAIPGRPTRNGLLVALDLDRFDYGSDSRSIIRPTEETIAERIPPRISVRRNAALELTHVLVLIDDPNKTIIEPCVNSVEGRAPLYDTDLMMGGGEITSYRLGEGRDTTRILRSLEGLIQKKLQPGDSDQFMFAVGDGNHSLCAAKEVWNQTSAILPKNDREIHPAKYALVELVNLHDAGVVFEPIHRVLFDVNPEAISAYLTNALGGHLKAVHSPLDVFQNVAKTTNQRLIGLCSTDRFAIIQIESSSARLPVAAVQQVLDRFIEEHPDAKMDYIHGDEGFARLFQKSKTLGIYLPPLDKHELFPFVDRYGVLPRKSFSLGEPNEKRYYFEARKIRL